MHIGCAGQTFTHHLAFVENNNAVAQIQNFLEFGRNQEDCHALVTLAHQFAMYKLNSSTTCVAEQLERARALAVSKGEPVRVFFDYRRGTYGVDKNSNGRLDAAEVEELPDGVSLSEDAMVVFTRTGTLARGSKEPQITISNTSDARRIKVSAAGAIEVD